VGEVRYIYIYNFSVKHTWKIQFGRTRCRWRTTLKRILKGVSLWVAPYGFHKAKVLLDDPSVHSLLKKIRAAGSLLAGA
jgi:hypothetical protein